VYANKNKITESIRQGDGFYEQIDIMSGIYQIPYDKVNVMESLKEEAVTTLGQGI